MGTKNEVKSEKYRNQRNQKKEHAKDVFKGFVAEHGNAISEEVVAAFRSYIEDEQKMAKRSVELYVSAVNEYLKSLGLEKLCYKQHRAADLSGRRFGELVALEPTDRRKGGSVVWRCKCEACGKEAFISAAALLADKAKTCGCVRAKKMHDALGVEHGTNLALVFSDKLNANNTSGHKGVSWSKSRNLWVATIGYKKKLKYLGGFESYAEAVEAREAAEKAVRLDAEQYLNVSRSEN